MKCVFIYPLAGGGAVVGMSFVHSKVMWLWQAVCIVSRLEMCTLK